MVAEIRPDYPSQWAAICEVARKRGIGTPETLRTWIRRAVLVGQRIFVSRATGAFPQVTLRAESSPSTWRWRSSTPAHECRVTSWMFLTGDARATADHLNTIGDAVAIGHRTMSVALQSIWLGIGLRLVLMGIAASGVIPAIVGAASQEVVDLASTLSAARARRAARRPGRPL